MGGNNVSSHFYVESSSVPLLGFLVITSMLYESKGAVAAVPPKGIRAPEPMRFEKAISTAISAKLTRHAPAWLVRFACNRRSFLYSNFSEPNQEAFIGYGEAEDERRLAPSEDDNEARAKKSLDLAHCSRHPDAHNPSSGAVKGTRSQGSLTASGRLKPRRPPPILPQPIQGAKPLENPLSRKRPAL